MLGELRTAGPRAARHAKRLVLERPDGPETARRIAERRTSDEGQEGLRAFLERRRPAWAPAPTRRRALSRAREAPMTAVLAIASALLVGGADFIGGFLSRSSARSGSPRSRRRSGWPSRSRGARRRRRARDRRGRGLVGRERGRRGLGLVLFYTAMTRGMISLVAPVAAVTGAVVPVVYALARDERPGTAAIVGIALAVAAIALVSLAPGDTPAARAPGSARSRRLRRRSPVRPLLRVPRARARGRRDVAGRDLPRRLHGRRRRAGARVTRGLRSRDGVPRIALIGVLEVGAAVTLLLALQRGPVSVASVLASLYPVTTTFLAALVLHERLRGSSSPASGSRSSRSC